MTRLTRQNPQLVGRVKALRAQGYSWLEIEKKTGIAQSTLLYNFTARREAQIKASKRYHRKNRKRRLEQMKEYMKKRSEKTKH